MSNPSLSQATRRVIDRYQALESCGECPCSRTLSQYIANFPVYQIVGNHVAVEQPFEGFKVPGASSTAL